MPRLSKDEWAQIRAEREAGLSFSILAKRHGVSKAAITKRARLEGWGDGADVAVEVRRKAMEKVVGVSAIASPQKKAEAIEAVAEAAAEVVRRHQQEVERVRELLWRGLDEHRAAETLDDKRLAFETLKAAKISSEALTNLQRLERISYGLDDGDAGGKAEIVIERSYGLVDGPPSGNGLTPW